jgi:hypothetical protein
MLARDSEARIGRSERLARFAQSTKPPADATLVLGSPKTLIWVFWAFLTVFPKLKRPGVGSLASAELRAVHWLLRGTNLDSSSRSHFHLLPHLCKGTQKRQLLRLRLSGLEWTARSLNSREFASFRRTSRIHMGKCRSLLATHLCNIRGCVRITTMFCLLTPFCVEFLAYLVARTLMRHLR